MGPWFPPSVVWRSLTGQLIILMAMVAHPAAAYITFTPEALDSAKEALLNSPLLSESAVVVDSARVLLVSDDIVELYERRDFLLVRASVIGFEEPEEEYSRVGFNKGRVVACVIKEIYCGGLSGYESGEIIKSLYYGSIPGLNVSVQSLSPGKCRTSSGHDTQVLFPGAEVLMTVWDGYPRLKKAKQGDVVTHVWRHLVVGDGGIQPNLRLDAIVDILEHQVCGDSERGDHVD